MDWINIKEKLPKEGQKTKCKVNFWRYGRIHHTEEIEAKHEGFNDIIGKPMWNIDTYEEAYAEVTHWVPF